MFFYRICEIQTKGLEHNFFVKIFTFNSFRPPLNIFLTEKLKRRNSIVFLKDKIKKLPYISEGKVVKKIAERFLVDIHSASSVLMNSAVK